MLYIQCCQKMHKYKMSFARACVLPELVLFLAGKLFYFWNKMYLHRNEKRRKIILHGFFVVKHYSL